MNIRTLALRVYDAVMAILPGHRSNPESFEARARKTLGHFSAEVDRATAAAQARIDKAIAATAAIEERIEAQARSTLVATEALIESAELRAKRLRQLLDGE